MVVLIQLYDNIKYRWSEEFGEETKTVRPCKTIFKQSLFIRERKHNIIENVEGQ